MSFLHLWPLFVGGAALAAPVIVHFLTKPKPVAMPLSTVRFLREVIEQRKTRNRLRDWLILLLRTACIALLAMALARPYLQTPPMVAAESQDESSRVIILDVSQSMLAGSGGVSSWTQGQAAGLQYLTVGQGTKADVIFCGARARPVFGQLSQNHNALREAIKQSQPVAERADPRSAMELAGKILGSGDAAKKELVIISDFQRSNWGTLQLDQLPPKTNVQFHATEQSITDNVAITSVRFSSNPIVSQTTILEVDIANYSERDVDVRCQIELTDLQRQLEGKIPAQSTQTLSTSVAFSAAGWKYGWAKLENNLDMLAEDDQRPCAILVRPSLRVNLVSRQAATEIPSSSFFVQSALQVALGTTSGESQEQIVSRVQPNRDDVRTWPECDVIVLDHPGALNEAAIQYLASQLRRGKGLLYITAELVDAVNIEKLRDQLGAEFQPPVDLLPPAANLERQNLFVTKVRPREAPFSILGSDTVSILKAVRLSGGLATRTTTEGLRDQVRAELSDTSALLYVTNVGAGQIAVLNVDLGRSNWAVQPSFLPVLSELLRALIDGRGIAEQAATGETMVRTLPPGFSEKSLLLGKTFDGIPPANGDYGRWEWSSSQGALVWNWIEPPGSGIYGLINDDQPAWMVATAAPGLEADLKLLAGEVLTERITEDRAVGYTTTRQQEEKNDDLWSWLIVACTLGLLGEVILLRVNRM